MPSLVNRVPPGLLSLLGIKAGGNNPSVLPDVLTPTLELLELYVAGNAVDGVAATSVITGLGVWGVAAFQPNPGELLYVERMSVSRTAGLAAGTTYTLQPCLYDLNTASKIFAVGPAITATAGLSLLTASERPFIVPPGYRLAAFCSQFVAGTVVSFNVAARYTTLSI